MTKSTASPPMSWTWREGSLGSGMMEGLAIVDGGHPYHTGPGIGQVQDRHRPEKTGRRSAVRGVGVAFMAVFVPGLTQDLGSKR